MEPGDYVVVALKNKRVGRIGQITGKAIGDDEWDPLVPESNDMPDGERGRRIFVRWELTTGPDNYDAIIQLPEDKTFNSGELRPAVARIRSLTVEELRVVMNDQKNWVACWLGGRVQFNSPELPSVSRQASHEGNGQKHEYELWVWLVFPYYKKLRAHNIHMIALL